MLKKPTNSSFFPDKSLDHDASSSGARCLPTPLALFYFILQHLDVSFCIGVVDGQAVTNGRNGSVAFFTKRATQMNRYWNLEDLILFAEFKKDERIEFV